MNRLIVAASGLGLMWMQPPAQASLPEVLRNSIANYAKLTSYADTGTVREEMPGIVDEAKFTTYFRRATRDLYLDYQDLTSTNPGTKFTIDMSASRTVFWMVKGEMQKFEFKTRNHEVINPDNGGQVRALQNGSHATSGVSMLIPSLLYSQARLPSAVLQIEEATVAGIEEINKRRCHKVSGIAAGYYPSGQRTNVRPVTVWIDVDTLLIRRVLEDTPKGYQAGAYLRIYTTFEPQANPTLDDRKFQFTVPQ